jgi:hypothetical protein
MVDVELVVAKVELGLDVTNMFEAEVNAAGTVVLANVVVGLTVTRFVNVTVVISIPGVEDAVLTDDVAVTRSLQDRVPETAPKRPAIGAAVHPAGQSFATVTRKPHDGAAWRLLTK